VSVTLDSEDAVIILSNLAEYWT